MATPHFQFSNSHGIAFPSLSAGVKEEGFFFRRFRGLVYSGKDSSIIGRGGSGVIHVVRDEIMDRVVALKLPNESILSEPQVRSEVLNEASQALELTHPNIVRIFDFHDQDGRWGISMQYVRGRNLDEWRDKIAPHQMAGGSFYDVEQIKPWILQLCEALGYAHEEVGIVHCDIKPRNLLLERSFDTRMRQIREKLLLTDFGITQKLRDFTTRTQRHKSTKASGSGGEDGGAAGTLAYMSPQQLSGKEGSVSDDIYAIGVTIYELLTGRPAFFQGDAKIIQHQIESVVPPSMMERRRERGVKSAQPIPDVWEQVTAQCLSKDADKRPASVRELVRLLGLTSGLASGLSPEEQRRLQEEADALKNKVETQEIHISTLTQRVGELQTAASGKVEEAALIEAREQFETLQTSLRRKEAQWMEIDEKLQDLEEEKLGLEQRLEDANNSILEAENLRIHFQEELNKNTQQAQEQAERMQLERDEAKVALQKSTESIATLRTQLAAASKEAADAASRAKTADALVKKAQDKADESRKTLEAAREDAEKKARQAINEAEKAQRKVADMAGQQAAPLRPILKALLGLIASGLIIGAAAGWLMGSRGDDGDVDALAAEVRTAMKQGGVLVLKRHVQTYLRQLGLEDSELGDHFVQLKADDPATGLSWLEATSFCDWLTRIASADPSKEWFDLPEIKELPLADGSTGKLAHEWTRDAADSSPELKMLVYSHGQSAASQKDSRPRAQKAIDAGFHAVPRKAPQ